MPWLTLPTGLALAAAYLWVLAGLLGTAPGPLRKPALMRPEGILDRLEREITAAR
jgi:hypothetical protein